MSLQLEARDLAATSLPGAIEAKEIQELRDKAHSLINQLLSEAGRKEPMSAFARADIHECIRRLRFFDMHLVDRLQAALAGAALLTQLEQEREREGDEGEASEELAPPKVKTKAKKPK
jgi:hypothetical protein